MILGAAAATTAAPSSTRAEIGAIHPDVLRAAGAVTSAKGPEGYAALRDLWRMWDRGDPTHVEEALRAFAEAKTTPAPLRVYADVLTAYARRRRGDLDGAAAKIESLGFVPAWLTVGPFDNESKEGFGAVYGPETEMDKSITDGRTYDGKERPVKWRPSPSGSGYGWFDFGELMRPRESTCAYATTFLREKGSKSGAAAKGGRVISIWVGAAGAFKLFWNGSQILEDAVYRDLDIDRFAAKVQLAPGNNRLTLKVCSAADDAPKFALRLGDESGAPTTEVEADASFEASSDDLRHKEKTAAPAPGGQPLLGPIQAFERLTSGPKPAPSALFEYARYLSVSGGDAAPEHKARDLAARAAEAEPTVERLLLAGNLAEDRNQEREYVAKAAKLAGLDDSGKIAGGDAPKAPPHLALDVRVAQAKLAATSVNFRDAVPMFERILAADPDHTGANLGLADLYVEAGLKRTAVASLERALARNPSSVALLRAYAGQLRAVGRDTEAAEVEVRYASLRFDDSGFLNQMVDLAVARRDVAGAERWLKRFLQSEPDSAWSRSVAARTYRALGQKDRALDAYRRALALAPEDVPTLRALSDLYGEEGDREEQLKLLQQILAVRPQDKEVREYVEHIEPPKPRADEMYAWAPERFLSASRTGADLRSPLLGEGSRRSEYPQRTLRNLTVTTVFPNGLSSSFHQIVYQPLTDEAAASARQYVFSYAGERQTVTLRAAKVYRRNGKIDEAVESREAGVSNPDIAMYTSQRVYSVNFPRLSAGDVVELRYRIEDTVPRNELSDSFGEIEPLQSDEPTEGREYVLITPKSRMFYVHVSPLPGLVKETKEDGDRRIYRFEVPKVAPLGFEPAMPPWASVVPYVHISTFKNWDELGAFYWGLAREQLDVDDVVRKKVREITKGLTDDKAKVKAVYKYATETRYVALEFGIEGIRPRRTAQTLARGWGDCKDKATLIVTMLRELGIPSTLVLVRTGERGQIGDFPASLAPFDHVIAYVPSMDLYLDGTAEHTGSNELPAMDRGAFALQINEGKPKLVRLPQPPAEESATRRKVDVSLLADGTAQLGVDVLMSGVWAPAYRSRYLAEGTRRERVAQALSSEFGAVELAPGKAGAEVNDLGDAEQPAKLKARGKSTAFARRDGDTLSMPAASNQRLAAQYASLSNRTLDVVLPALTLLDDEWTIRLPPGMKVLRAPLPLEMDTPFGQYAVAVEQVPGKVVVRSRLSFKKARITAEEYTAFRVFCESADRAFGQRLVVGK